MKLSYLKLKNIGPFRELSVSFEKDEGTACPVVIFTGENGSGKSIVIDSIRTVLRGLYGIERNIVANTSDFLIELGLVDNMIRQTTNVNRIGHNGKPTGSDHYRDYFNRALTKENKVPWVVDYWCSDIPSDTFKIGNVSAIQTQNALLGSLDKTTPNVDLAKFISSIDYLKGSEKREEAERGKHIYELITKIFDDCVDEGAFSHIERETITPMVKTHGLEVSLEKLSSGNILLVKHFVGLLSRMYGICRMNEMDIKELNKIEGVLLIDEIENHLHPKWQKSIVGIIRKHFPNLQIILTTHSPFVVSSVNDAKIYVCVGKTDHCDIEDATSDYSGYPVDDVLGTLVFDVDPFSKKISEKLNERKKAIRDGDKKTKEKVEKELIELNEGYFGYYDLKGLLSYYEKDETH